MIFINMLGRVGRPSEKLNDRGVPEGVGDMDLIQCGTQSGAQAS